MTVRLNDNARDGYPIAWDIAEGDPDGLVTVYAVGEAGDVHNKAPQHNTGKAGIFYPEGFTGTSFVEIRDAEGNVLDAGEIEIA